ncbi:LysM peptidoglycan-binding domain-containing protein [Geobacillus thermoleovorans]|uniref:M23 family metallopeptidase n=1 Tax=Geobacillus thermoleovorans TaxID=33941 RepID=UPI00345C0CC6
MRKGQRKRTYGAALVALWLAGGIADNVNASNSAYTAQNGDSLWKIAHIYGVSIADLKSWNNLASDTIYPGQTLRVTPPSTNNSSSSSAAAAIVYTVRAGDSLYAIAQKYGVTVADLKTANRLSTDTIYVGQTLTIPQAAPTPPTAPPQLQDGIFPLKAGTYTPFSDTYGQSRSYGGERRHEGTDIFASKGTPVYAAVDGTVVRYGWSELGGWRLTIRTKAGLFLYYAHLQGYAANLSEGQAVVKGQLVGFVGDSGYGPVGTTGKFVPHLHVGLYDANWNAINPYPYLKYWEQNGLRH